MKKIVIPFLIVVIYSCNNTGTNSNSNADSTVAAPDTTIHPNGVNEGAVISTDTAAYKVKDSVK
jgi:hypothetical protein